MPKQDRDQIMTDILVCSDQYRSEAAVTASGQRLAACTPAEIKAAKDELNADHVGYNSARVDAAMRRR